MEKKTYTELLKDPRWQKKRLEIMQRDEFKCQHCFATDKSLQVHHLAYHKGYMPWEYENDELITLCETCHQNETEDSRALYAAFQDAVLQFKKRKFSSSILLYILNYLANTVRFEDNNDDNKEFYEESAKEIIKTCIYSCGEIGDVIAAFKIGIDVSDYAELFFGEYSELFESIKKSKNEKL